MGATESKQCGNRKNDPASAPTAASGLRRGLTAIGVVLIAIGVLGAIGVFNPAAQRQTIAHTLPLDESGSATLALDGGIGVLSVNALPEGSADLLTTDLRYVGTYRLDDDTSARVRTVTLTHDTGWMTNLIPFSFFADNDDDQYTRIDLTRAIPLDLTLNLGVNNGTVDLTSLQLSRLNVNGGLGRDHAAPAGGELRGGDRHRRR